MWTTFKNLGGLELFLTSAITLYVSLGIVAIVLLFISRSSRNYKEKLEIKYTPAVETVLFSLLFFNKSLEEVLALEEYKSNYKKKTFKKVLLASAFKLHINYSGDFNEKLNEFYRKTKLINVSMAKFHSEDWDQVCTGIRELTQFNVHDIEPELQKYLITKSTNTILQLESILGLIRLRGVEGLSILLNYKKPVNDWVQTNILHAIRHSDRTNVPDFSIFLKSKNESVVVLGLRLIAMFNQGKHSDLINEMFMLNGLGRVKNQAELTLDKLASINLG
ncbi:MAG: hypothetical protein EPO57_02795 [Chitinophagaceae bacterium]|nr:MAG: hypothetical protein EPO57_02795 [Chitinophagaceae bacterium]